ncbi:MAG TPA: alpha/beta fold hydrolase [Candidatus Wallbacteria bacterium]|nr:MAG: Alpha/beta hydrolase family protein [bacterium ADurb.Bin243]HPG56388.1 alpha/beta fold hydrolase [Candidatus Wallbacteria bacterium]
MNFKTTLYRSLLIGFLASALLLFSMPAAARNAGAHKYAALLSAELIAERSLEDIESFLVKNKIPQTQTAEILNAAKETTVNKILYYKLKYSAVDESGNPYGACGLVALPGRMKEYPLVSYQHGTIFDDSAAPSMLDKCSEAEAVACVFALRGFAVAMADYRGLGEPVSFHPYFHAQATALDCSAFLTAVKQFLNASGAAIADGKIYLAGFSQGGHATLALHRHLESGERPSAGAFKVAASAVIAGACDPDLLLRSWIIRPNALSAVVAGRILASYSLMYGPQVAECGLFEAPYGDLIRDIVMRGNTIEKTMKLPATLKGVLNDKFMSLYSQGRTAFNKVLAENAAYKNWKPLAPVNLYHGGSDTIVPPVMSAIVCRRLKLSGAQAELIGAGEKTGHPDAIIISCLMAAKWFESLK